MVCSVSWYTENKLRLKECGDLLPARRQIMRLIRYMPPEKLYRLLKFAEELDDELTPAEIDDVAAAKD